MFLHPIPVITKGCSRGVTSCRHSIKSAIGSEAPVSQHNLSEGSTLMSFIDNIATEVTDIAVALARYCKSSSLTIIMKAFGPADAHDECLAPRVLLLRVPLL